MAEFYTLAELVRSSQYVMSASKQWDKKHEVYDWKLKDTKYSMQDAIQKTFGTIYYNNKVVIYNEDTGILEIRMGIGTKTEKSYQGMHSVRMAIYGVEGQVYDSIADLIEEKTGQAQGYVPNSLKQAIRGETDIGQRRLQHENQRIRRANHQGGRTLESDEEVNHFTYGDRFEGYIIPVASINPDTGAYTYEDSGKIFYMEKPIDVNSIVRVSCSCSSYFFTFAYYNYQHGIHLGQQPAPYPGKTDQSITKLNYYKRPGMCKHLMMFTMLLLNGGIIKKEGTHNFEANLQLIRNRAEKLQVPRKLADNSDWGNHLRELERSLFKADKMRRTEYQRSGNTDLYQLSPDGYYDWSKYKVHQRQTSGHKGNLRKGLTRDAYIDAGARDAFGRIMNKLDKRQIQSQQQISKSIHDSTKTRGDL